MYVRDFFFPFFFFTFILDDNKLKKAPNRKEVKKKDNEKKRSRKNEEKKNENEILYNFFFLYLFKCALNVNDTNEEILFISSIHASHSHEIVI